MQYQKFLKANNETIFMTFLFTYLSNFLPWQRNQNIHPPKLKYTKGSPRLSTLRVWDRLNNGFNAFFIRSKPTHTFWIKNDPTSVDVIWITTNSLLCLQDLIIIINCRWGTNIFLKKILYLVSHINKKKL